MSVSASNSTTLTLVWAPPQLEHRNGVIRQYAVNITEQETESSFTIYTEDTSIIVADLHPFYTYWCTIAAETISFGPVSPIVSIEMPEDGMHSLSLVIPLCSCEPTHC